MFYLESAFIHRFTKVITWFSKIISHSVFPWTVDTMLQLLCEHLPAFLVPQVKEVMVSAAVISGTSSVELYNNSGVFVCKMSLHWNAHHQKYKEHMRQQCHFTTRVCWTAAANPYIYHWYVSPSSASLCVSSPLLSCFLCPDRLSWPPLPRRAAATEERKPEPRILMPWYFIHGTPRFSVMQMEWAVLGRRDISEYEDKEVLSEPCLFYSYSWLLTYKRVDSLPAIINLLMFRTT